MVAHLNVPVWVEHVTDHEEPPFVALGMMLTRKGECRIWKAPATAAQAQELRQRMLRVWAHRADAQFRRYGFPLETPERLPNA